MSKRYNKTDWYTKLARAWFRLTHRKSMRHVAHSLPHLRLTADGERWKIYWRKQHKGQTMAWAPLTTMQPNLLYVVGSGPSVAEQDLSQIGDAPTLVVNGAASLIADGTLKNPIGVVMEDARFVRQRPDFIEGLPRSTPLFVTQSVLQALGAMNGDWLSQFPVYFMQGFTARYWQPWQPLECFDSQDYRASDNAALSLDLSQGVFGCGTVMYAASQVALMHGASHIRLAGLDLTNFEQPRFYEQRNDQAWTGLQNAYETRILPAFTLLKNVCDERGVTIENCSHTSIIPREVLPFSDALMPPHDGRTTHYP